MSAYYNEIEPFAAEWLRRLIAQNLIAPGEVDERSIVDVLPDDLRGFKQCHFFAGIGGWSYALRLAGWPDDRPVWTGSCPCQPFSAAGKQRGSNDERHLWPAFHDLIRECRPPAVFGEQVAGAAGLAWLDHVCADLEESGYAAAAADLPACGVGAPHRRQRLWWVAHSTGERKRADESGRDCGKGQQLVRPRAMGNGSDDGATGRMADSEESGSSHGGTRRVLAELGGSCGAEIGRMADADGGLASDGNVQRSGEHRLLAAGGRSGALDDPAGWRHQGDSCRDRLAEPEDAFASSRVDPWRDLEWLPCSDGKARPTESAVLGVFDGLSDRLGYRRDGDRFILSPLIQGATNRVGRLRAYGNAITPQVAAEFVAAVMECQP